MNLSWISFRVLYERKAYVIHASTGSMKCFECGDIGHKKHACPHKAQSIELDVVRPSTSAAAESTETVFEGVQPRAESQEKNGDGFINGQIGDVNEIVC